MVQYKTINPDGLIDKAIAVMDANYAHTFPEAQRLLDTRQQVSAIDAALRRTVDDNNAMLKTLVSRPVFEFTPPEKPAHNIKRAEPGGAMWVALRWAEANPGDGRVLRDVAEGLGVSYETVRKAKKLVNLTTFDNETHVYTWEEKKGS